MILREVGMGILRIENKDGVKEIVFPRQKEKPVVKSKKSRKTNRQSSQKDGEKLQSPSGTL